MATNYNDIQTSLVRIPFVLKAYIQATIQAISAKYTYTGERGVNPAFQSLAQVHSGLLLNEKRAFALRSDFIIATGVKNAYQEYNYHGLEKILEQSVHQHVNWEDRYGHPSLTIADDNYDGKVFYAGFICQRTDYLEIFLSSGRFNRVDRTDEGIYPLSDEQITLIETHLALQFCKAYGDQKVVFYDTLPGKPDDEDSALFFTDTPFPDTKKFRSYTSESIAFAAERAEATLNYVRAEHYIQDNIPSIKPQYSYANEDSINPAFQNIEQVHYPLQYLEKRIWALRSDFILATGVKNAYQEEYGYNGLADSFSKSILQFLNWGDRYGHPSLTISEGDYDGGVFYAGYVCQRRGYLQVYLASGRFDRNDLSEQQRAILEAYIAAKLQVAYGRQDLVFD